MNIDFWIGFSFGVLCSAAVFVLFAFYYWRELSGDIEDWSEEAYEPRRDQPRAVTRIHSNDLDWEIR